MGGEDAVVISYRFDWRIVYCLWTVWLMLLAYRIVGKTAGQDPRYDTWIAYWSGTFKFLGVLGILLIVLQVILRLSFVVGRL